MIRYELINHNTECKNRKQILKSFITDLFSNNGAPYLHKPNELFYNNVLDKNVVKIFAYHHDELIGFSALKFLENLPDYFLFSKDITSLMSPLIEHTAFIWFNSVSSKYRQQGIGKEMLKRRMDYARDAGRNVFLATAHPDNTASVKALQNGGLKPIKTIPLFETQELRHIMFLDDR